jgi:hypothetical protein
MPTIPWQIRRPGSKLLHRLSIPPRRHRHEMALIAYVDPCRIRMHDRQSRICRVQLLPNSLRCSRFKRPPCKRSNVDIFLFAMAYSL